MILLAVLLALPVTRTQLCDKTQSTHCASVDASGAVSISGTINATSATHNTAAAPSYVEGTDNAFSGDLSGSLRVICMGGTCGGASPFSDGAAFTAGTTSVSVTAGVFDDTLAALAAGKAGAPRITGKRAVHFNMRDNSGAEIPFPAALDADLGFKVHVQNSVAVTGPLTDAQLRASAVPTTDAHTTAGAPLSLRLSDGAAFYDATKTGQLPAALDGSGFLKTHEQGTASTNVAQVAGTTTDTNSGVKSAGTLRVVLATDQPALTNKLLVTPDSVALPANQSVNVNQLAGTTTDTNSGVKSAGTLRVVLATDQPALTNKLLVTPDSVALPANQSVNVSQINGVTPLMGNGVTGTGSQRVTIASDNTAFSVNAAATQGAGNTANPWAVQGTVADDGPIAGNPVPIGLKAAVLGAAPAAGVSAAADVSYALGSTERILFTLPFHPNMISCHVAVSTATTITAVGGSCAAPGANKCIFITSATFSASAASGTAADSMPTLKSGTGGTCGTATAVVFAQFNPANGGWHAPFPTPYKVPVNSELCWIDSTAGSKLVDILGFIAPC